MRRASDGDTNERRLTVLISSAGRRVELVRIFRRAVAELTRGGRVLAADSSWYSSASHEADEGIIAPEATDAAFVPAMLASCAEHGVDVVVPTADRELGVWAAARARFAAIGTAVAVSAPEAVAIARDRLRTHAWLTEHGFPTVRQGRLREALAEPAAWPVPLVVKPRFAGAGEGACLVRTREELAALVERESDRAFAGEAGCELLVQSLAGGVEHTIDVLVDGVGRCVSAVPRRRLETRGGEVSKAVTVRSAPLIALARRLGEALPGAHGALNFHVFLDDATGGLAVLDVNARFGAGFPLSWRAGADHARWLLEDACGLTSSVTPACWRDGLVMLRYDAAVFVDQASAPVGRRSRVVAFDATRRRMPAAPARARPPADVASGRDRAREGSGR
jgi:carbamoyl-phosphate synthase large subunit